MPQSLPNYCCCPPAGPAAGRRQRRHCDCRLRHSMATCRCRLHGASIRRGHRTAARASAAAAAAATAPRNVTPGGCFPRSRLVGRHGRPGRLRPRAARSALRRAAFRASRAAIVAGNPPPWLPARRAPKRAADGVGMAGRGGGRRARWQGDGRAVSSQNRYGTSWRFRTRSPPRDSIGNAAPGGTPRAKTIMCVWCFVFS